MQYLLKKPMVLMPSVIFFAGEKLERWGNFLHILHIKYDIFT